MSAASTRAHAAGPSPAAQGFALFSTTIGGCGIAWSELGVVGVQLPESSEQATRARLRRRFPEAREAAPPPGVGRVLGGIVALLRGEASDFAAAKLDMAGIPDFHRRVYEVARTIPPGSTLSYGEVARRLGAPGAARAVGQALGRNPLALVVPCHRVLAAGGRVGGFSAGGGTATKLRLLAIEGGRAQGELFEGDGAVAFESREAVARLRAADPGLARLIDRVGPFDLQLQRAPSLFAALAEAIVYQQLTGKAAETIFARVRALFPRAHAAPTAEQIQRVRPAQLRAAGLSRAKVLALKDLARRTVAGTLPSLAEASRLDDQAIVDRLVEVRGIGRWTAEMLLIFRLGRPDVLPADDYGVRQGYAIAFRKRKLPSRRDLETHGRRWRPFRTVASWYLWRAAELAKASPAR